MSTDRKETLNRAEKLLRQGRLEAAIAEYDLAVAENPGDWNTANLLGDLYVRAGQIPRACEQFTRVADHLANDGFVAKAAALYKKVIKLNPADDPALLRSADLAAKQGLTADVRAHMSALFQLRLRRGDREGAVAAAHHRIALDPADVLGRLDAARMLAEAGDVSSAAGEMRHAGLALRDMGRIPDAIRVLREALRLEPGSEDTRTALLDVFLAQGDPAGAADYAATAAEWRVLASKCRTAGFEEAARGALARLLDREPDDVAAREELAGYCMALGDWDGAAAWVTADAALASPPLAVILAEIYFRQGNLDEAGALLAEALSRDGRQETAVTALATRLIDVDLDAATAALMPVVDALCDRGDLVQAREQLDAFVRTSPGPVTALQRLIEVCVDGGFSAQLGEAQIWLADALLAKERWQEARSIAEDLVAVEPGHAGHAERLQRALRGLGLDADVSVDVDLATQLENTESDKPDRLLSDDFSSLLAVLSAEASTIMPASQAATAAIVPQASTTAIVPQASTTAIVPQASTTAIVPQASGDLERVDMSAAPVTLPAVADEFDLSRSPAHVAPRWHGSEQAMTDADLRRLFEDHDTPPQNLDPANGGAFEVDLSLALSELLAEESVTGREIRPDDLDGFFRGLRDETVTDGRTDEAHGLLRDGEASYAAGQFDQATRQLRAAAREPGLRLRASRLIARIARDRGNLTEAIEWLERAAEVPVPDIETWQGLLYELADTLEAAGEHVRALAVLLELRAATPGYRDVDARAAELSSRQARP